ncbi:hypothetical protein D3C85_894230 [compost metagenome]
MPLSMPISTASEVLPASELPLIFSSGNCGSSYWMCSRKWLATNQPMVSATDTGSLTLHSAEMAISRSSSFCNGLGMSISAGDCRALPWNW